jgi:hypothetical protein
VALLADSVHNVADALTAEPLWIAFVVGRRAATRRYTYGYGRARQSTYFLSSSHIANTTIAIKPASPICPSSDARHAARSSSRTRGRARPARGAGPGVSGRAGPPAPVDARLDGGKQVDESGGEPVV